MKSQHRGILAIALSAGFFLLWFTVISPPQKAPVVPEQTAAAAEQGATNPAAAVVPTAGIPAAAASVVDKNAVADPQANVPVKTWTIKNSLVEVDLTSDGGVPTSWRVVGYHEGTDPKSPLIDLAAEVAGATPPLALSFSGANFMFPAKPRYELVAADETHVVYRWRSSEAEVVKTITFKPESYLVDVAVDVKGLTEKALTGRPVLGWSGVTLPVKKGGFFSFLKQPSVDNKVPVFYLDGKVRREANVAKLAPTAEQNGTLLWAGLESRYFLGAIVPRVQGQGLSVEYGAAELAGAELGTRSLFAAAALPQMTAPQGDVAKALFSVYAGPKEIDQLKAAGVRLEEAIDYGWFTVVAVPILYLLKFFHSVLGNYGIAIILLTIFVKLLLHPINVKSLKSMKSMTQLQPRLKELQAKFKDDKQKLNQETMQLFRAHKVNPMGGCLPMLLQFPIYIALYKVLWNSIELYHAPFFWFYRDLSAPDPYLITPILLGIFMVAQQKLMPSTSADPAQQKMMMLMPLMFSVFMLFLPVGLVVYILVNTVMSVTQQWMYNKGIRYRDLIRGKWKPAAA